MSAFESRSRGTESLDELARLLREEEDAALALRAAEPALRARLAACSRPQGRRSLLARSAAWGLARADAAPRATSLGTALGAFGAALTVAVAVLVSAGRWGPSTAREWLSRHDSRGTGGAEHGPGASDAARAAPEPQAAPEALAFTVGAEGRRGVLHEWVAAGAGAPQARAAGRVDFSDGSRLQLEPGGRARVVRLSPEGAEVVLEAGRALVTVVPRPRAAWSVRSGPFVVQVTGTRFAVAWSAAEERLVVELFEGSVLVQGCNLGDGHALHAGLELTVSCKHDQVAVAPLGAGSPGAGAGPAALGAVETFTPRQRVGRLQEAAPDWVQLARRGDHAAAYRWAEQRGFDTECAARESDEVLLLADTARLAGSPARARQAYLALRARFPGSSRAARGAFHLGRLDSEAGLHAEAARWYETYLAEERGGVFAQAALGRLLEARASAGQTSAARDVAERYLSEYPAGPHADQARTLLHRATP